MANRVIGVIGGSGIYDLPGLKDVEEVSVSTPFGEPSGRYVVGTLGDDKMVFLARHGQGHRILPHEINYRANIYGMKLLGVEWLISLSAVGSMREDIRPGDIVIVDQFLDRTRARPSTFFGGGIAAHVSFADPVSPVLAKALHEAASERVAARKLDERVHSGGTYVVIDGPQFSTRAESNLYRQWGVDVIGMTNLPEAKLAREAEISYASIALATDYDCWHDTEDAVSVEGVLAVLAKNAELAREVVAATPAKLPKVHECIAARALESAIMTKPDHLNEQVRIRLSALIDKYLP